MTGLTRLDGLTYDQAADLWEEYHTFHAEGPPYHSPNGHVLAARDRTIDARFREYLGL